MTQGRAANVLLRSVREAHGYATQSQLAEALNRTAAENGLGELSITPRTIRRWESAKPPRPLNAHAQALELLLGQPIAALGLKPRTEPEPTAESSGYPDPTPPPIVDVLHNDSIAEYRALTATYRRLSRTLPATALLAPLSAHTRLGNVLAAAESTAPLAVASAAAEAWLLLGRMELLDIRNAAAAEKAFRSGLDHAYASEDSSLTAAVLAHLALTDSANANHAAAVQHLRMARALARRDPAPPHLDAWLDATDAQLCLEAAETAQALAMISSAEEITHSAAEPPPWLDWLSPHRLAALKASILLAAGRTIEARSTLDHASRNLDETQTRARVLLLADVAEIAAYEGEPMKAAAALTEAISAARSTGQASAAPLILAARRSLANWDELPAVRALDDQLIGWRPTLSESAR